MQQAPEATYSFKHRLPIQMRFNDIDMLGHVNNSIYLQYMDLAKADYISNVLGDAFCHKREAVVIVSLHTDFFHITIPGEQVEVLTAVDHIAEKSMIMHQRVVNSDTGEVKCVCRTVTVGFNIANNTSMTISDTWRERISQFEGRPMPKPENTKQI